MDKWAQRIDKIINALKKEAWSSGKQLGLERLKAKILTLGTIEDDERLDIEWFEKRYIIEDKK